MMTIFLLRKDKFFLFSGGVLTFYFCIPLFSYIIIKIERKSYKYSYCKSKIKTFIIFFLGVGFGNFKYLPCVCNDSWKLVMWCTEFRPRLALKSKRGKEQPWVLILHWIQLWPMNSRFRVYFFQNWGISISLAVTINKYAKTVKKCYKRQKKPILFFWLLKSWN